MLNFDKFDYSYIFPAITQVNLEKTSEKTWMKLIFGILLAIWTHRVGKISADIIDSMKHLCNLVI